MIVKQTMITVVFSICIIGLDIYVANRYFEIVSAGVIILLIFRLLIIYVKK